LHAPKAARLNNALALCTSTLRVAYATAFLEARAARDPSRDADGALGPIAHATDLRGAALDFLALLPSLSASKHPHAGSRRALISAQLLSVTDSCPGESAPATVPEPLPLRTRSLEALGSSSHLCTAALCAGWEIADGVQMWAQVDLGSFSASGRTFIPGPRSPQAPARDWDATEVRTIPATPGGAPVHVYISYGQIVAITSSARLRTSTPPAAGAPARSLLSLPDFIALPRDKEGRPIIPKSRVTALVEAQDAWHHELGQLDQLSSTIVRGLLVMPKVTTPLLRKTFRNHPSWEDDPAAQAALGPIIAKWLAQGVLEYVQWDDRHPVLLQPCGAVPKGTAPFYRLITDARFGNTMYSDWGVTYTSAADLSAALHPRDFTWSADLEDAYHLSVFAGCGGALRPCKRPIIAGDGTVSWIDGYIVGCSPDTCLGGCDKDMSGICISGHVFRFAACQFGQKTAGSPLNSLVLSVARYFARLPTPVHVATWVDDLHFSMRTPDHPPCEGHQSGCPVCTAAYHRAVEAEALWRQKAKALHLPLSAGKGHSVAQGGPFTGVHIDTLRGLYTMLADKLASLRETFACLFAADTVTPRLLARGRGKASHYGCAIPLLAAMCPALTQAIHQAEMAFDLPAPELDSDAAPDFDWDATLHISDRTRAVLRLMLRTIDELGSHGQPIWPVSPAAALGAFRAGQPGFISALVHFSAAQWGMSIRTRPDGPPVPLHGPWDLAHSMFSAPWMSAPAFSEHGAPVEHAHSIALATVLGITAAAAHADLTNHTIIVRVPSTAIAAALRHGSTSDPALQDIILLLQAARLQLRLLHLLFLPAPPTLGAPLTPSQIAETRLDSSAPRLLSLVHSLASSAHHHLTLDLFATTHNAVCPRFFSQFPEHGAEACDAFLQESWSSSHCPWCHRTRPDFVLLFPPHHLVSAAIRRAEHDQAHGIAILPCASTSAWWHTALAASRTAVRRFQPFCRIRCSDSTLLHGSYQPGSRLAVFHFDFWRGTDPRPRPCCHGTYTRGPRTDPAQDHHDVACLHHAWAAGPSDR
jgi:hypothetical protein